MSKNLVTAGIIVPAKWPLARVWLEVSALLGIAPRQIEHLEMWQHQIWVKIIGSGAIFVSYRCLPLWIEQGLEAISQCRDRDRLNQLGEIFSREVQRYGSQYNSTAVEQWRSAWGEKAKQLKIDEERLKPLRERQQACLQWQEGWRQVLRYCGSVESLEGLAPEIKVQTQQFEDLPESKTVMELWHQRWKEITHASA
ncbi:MAG: hypothetical protein WAN66_01980 [Limnoraphis robusta]|uniref:hypothetical protein n=1 Tax=Limnoraphis robusta TaxID=1118279 RepID=UPI002B200B4F|nr:hypothetical protein [Limnoraphis robusta]MEA5497974.1 hypothetical protein [Limnoraphis robusta BA-68 BA1]